MQGRIAAPPRLNADGGGAPHAPLHRALCGEHSSAEAEAPDDGNGADAAAADMAAPGAHSGKEEAAEVPQDNTPVQEAVPEHPRPAPHSPPHRHTPC